MAKVSGDPNSATSEWFISVANNSFLDADNGGFTVFGRVTAPGMVVADTISQLPKIFLTANSTERSLPLQNYQGGTATRNNLVFISAVTEFPANPSVSDRIINYLEAAYPQYLSPSNGVAGTWEGYTYRYYSGSNAYVATKDGQVWYLVPAINANINSLGTVDSWFATAQQAGY